MVKVPTPPPPPPVCQLGVDRKNFTFLPVLDARFITNCG